MTLTFTLPRATEPAAIIVASCAAFVLAASIISAPAAAQDQSSGPDFTLSGVEDIVAGSRRTLRDIDDTSRSFQRNRQCMARIEQTHRGSLLDDNTLPNLNVRHLPVD